MNKISSIFILLFLTFFVGCSSDDDNAGVSPAETKKTEINDFLWKGLNSWYFWKDNVEALDNNAFSSNAQYLDFLNQHNPEDLFYGLLYDYPNTDRFSWVVDDVNELLKGFSGISLSSGIDFSLAYLDQDAGTVIGLVNYVVENSPAHLQGIERGDLIVGVNGEDLTANNYLGLYDDSFSIKIGKQPVVNNGTIEVSTYKELTINAVELEENPVHYYNIIEEGNKKIGYLVYNGYKAVYNQELNEVFANFKAAGITDLILDLRYNAGGSLNSAVGLAQMITGQFTNQPFVSLEFNNNHANENELVTLSNQLPLYSFVDGQTQYVGEESINGLNLNKLYVLTSGGTASASELTISGLSSYIDVVQIGSQTYGKFVGSITLFDSPNADYTNYNTRNTNHDYAMQPIVFAYYNANHEYFTQGLMPNYSVQFGDYIGMREFGNTQDAALAKALELITGYSYRKTYKETGKISTQFLGTRKTLQKFGTELYIEPDRLNKAR